jgi:hypothetical protein
MTELINKQTYQICATRYFKIGTSAPSNNPSDSAQWNNDFKFSKNFSVDLSKHIDIVKFSQQPSQGTSGEVTNFGMYAWFLVSFANGATVGGSDGLTNWMPLECHFTVNSTYEDA